MRCPSPIGNWNALLCSSSGTIRLIGLIVAVTALRRGGRGRGGFGRRGGVIDVVLMLGRRLGLKHQLFARFELEQEDGGREQNAKYDLQIGIATYAQAAVPKIGQQDLATAKL